LTTIKDPVPMRVPFMDLSRTSRVVWNEINSRILALGEHADFISGPDVKEFENRLAQQCSVKDAIACANGTDAIILALQAAGIGPGSRVALPNLTFWATYEAVIHVGAIPVLIDVDPAHLQISIDELFEAHARGPIDACIVVHLFGWCHPRLRALRERCKAEGIVLIEDGAQAFGVTLTDDQGAQESVFKGAELATLSFYPAKVLGGCMDGGAVTTSSAPHAAKVRSLLNHGRRDHYAFEWVGWNSRMSSFQGAYLSAAITHVGAWIQQRRELLQRYEQLLKSQPLQLVRPPEGVAGNGYLAVLRLPAEQVAEVQSRLSEAGIGTGRVYPETIHNQRPAAGALRYSNLSVSTQFTQEVLNLPLFPRLSPGEQDDIVATLVRAFN